VYCQVSMSTRFAHIWVGITLFSEIKRGIWLFLQLLVIASASLFAGVIAILQFYKASKSSIGRHKPVLKLLCIKVIVILDSVQTVDFLFWKLYTSQLTWILQEVIRILISKNVLSPSKTWTYGDLSVMIPALLISVESFVVSILFLFAYIPKDYFISRYPVTPTMVESGDVGRITLYSGGFLGYKAMFDSLFMWDLVSNTVQTFKFVPSLFRQEQRGRSWPVPERWRSESSQQEYPKTQDETSSTMTPMKRDYSPYGNVSAHIEGAGIELDRLR